MLASVCLYLSVYLPIYLSQSYVDGIARGRVKIIFQNTNLDRSLLSGLCIYLLKFRAEELNQSNPNFSLSSVVKDDVSHGD